MKHQAWEVYIGQRWIDTVFFQADMDAEDVKRSLVEHDGYSSNIRLKRG